MSVIRDEAHYDQAIQTLDQLLEIVADDETHPLYALLETLSTLVHTYEEEHYPMGNASGAEVLKFLMAEHQLAPNDLSELGDETIVSEILAEQRELNVEQIRALAKRFAVSPATFI